MTHDIVMQIQVDAPATRVYDALTSTEGGAGWWTTRNETIGRTGGVDRFWFPDVPFPWEMRVDA